METLRLLAWGIDALLGLSLLCVAWWALTSTDMFRAVVLFVVFGLVMALAWVRLAAPDVALAEAAIGAGLTGALLLAALARLRLFELQNEAVAPHAGKRFFRGATGLIVVCIGVGLVYVVLRLLPDRVGLGAQVSAQLDRSGVGNPVTAVLLNFRAYDTLLEVFVLLLALLGVWSSGALPAPQDQGAGPVLDTLSRFLAPVFVLVAAYLLWVGAQAPGGAFQAGSVLGAAGVLLMLSGWRLRRGFSYLPLRLALLAGPAVFIGVSLLTLLGGEGLLSFPPTQAAVWILVLESAATLSIGVTLAALFLGTKPKDGEPQ